jgi:DNA-directed RNA polymerase specialized sigma24 family protein
MSRVDLLRDIGLDVETAVILDDELSRLPERTQRVFEMRARGYTFHEIGESCGVTKQAVHRERRRYAFIAGLVDKRPDIRAYSNRGPV